MTNPPPVPAKGGMPKWLIILLVIFLIIVLGCCGGFATCVYLAKRAAQEVGGAAGPAVGTFVQNQLKKEGVEIDTSGAGLAMPADFPTDIPIYPGMKVVSKAQPPGSKAIAISLTGGDTASLSAYYEKEMAAQGWKQVQSSLEANAFTQAYTKDKRSVQLIGGGGSGGASMQIIHSSGE